jgi:Rad3-related DNA helicase
VSLARRVEELLSPGGVLAGRWPGYEDRPGQRDLARDVAATFERGGVLLAEAPTGIGKSVGYLLPALLAIQATDLRVIVATCTKSLQDQLFERDLPVLLQAMGSTITCARLKGKQNYVCAHALETAEGDGAEERAVLDHLRTWAAEDDSGDLDRFPARDPEGFRRVRARVGADPDACTALTCRRGRECFWLRARRRAAEARLVVVNHALLAIASETDGLVPPFELLVVDEAHRLEGMLLAQLERGVSRHRFEESLRRVGSGRRRSGGLAARIRGLMMPLFEGERRETMMSGVDALTERVTAARETVERFFAAIEPAAPGHALYGARDRYRSSAELLGRNLEPLEALLGDCAFFARQLASLAQQTADPRGAELGPAQELTTELERTASLWSVLGADLENLAEAAQRDWVYWRSSGGRGVELRGAPISVGDAARRLLTGRCEAAVLTSATLSTAGDFDFAGERLGLGETSGVPYHAVAYPSPFPLERQMRTFVWNGDGPEAEVVADVVAALAARTGRSQLVLLTAHERLRRVRDRLREQLPDVRVLLAQEWDGSASRVSERFRAARGSILLGVQSLWEGVDFPGEALEILVVAKLPFSVPDEPRAQARGERLLDRGLDPFRADALPEAVLRFRQGVGRLIRRADDRGVLVVCDPRLRKASYRSAFLAALPAAPQAIADATQLAEEAARFFEQDAQVTLAEDA